MPLLFLLISLWFVRGVKPILFWLFLWQIKEYKICRLLDHFNTDKGKKLILNPLFLFKFFFIFLLFFPFFDIKILSFFIVFIYLFESLYALTHFFQKRLKIPVFTKKIILLLAINLLFQFIFVFYLFLYFQKGIINTNFIIVFLLIFDILIPLFISLSLLIIYPFVFFAKKHIIKKAIKKRNSFKKLWVVGITGSYGKTSTKEFLAKILSKRFKVAKTKEHRNTEMGVAQSILEDLKEGDDVFVVEMGAYKRGEIKTICNIAQPQLAILTGINEQHLALFGSQENIIKGKYELIESLPPLGFAVFNGDNYYCQQLYKKANVSKRICYSTFSALTSDVIKGDFWVDELKTEKDSVRFKVFSRWGDIGEFKVFLPSYFVQNLLMAAVVAKEVLGMSLEEIAAAAKEIKPKEMGVKIIKKKNGPTLIDSTYSSNPDGVISHLEHLKIWSGKKVIIMPCLIELGSASRNVHFRIGQKIAEVCQLAIITTKENFKDIFEGALQNGMPTSNILFSESPKNILKKIEPFSLREEDVILLEGRISSEIIEEIKKFINEK